MPDNEDDKSYLTAADGTLMLVRFSTSPLRYLIYPKFTSVLEVLDELKLPKYENDIYDLRFLSVEEYLREWGYAHSKLDERYQNYTVQIFASISRYMRGINLLLHPPGLPQYNYQPVYRDLLDIQPIEVWRKRVLSCSLKEIKTSVHNPFGVIPPGTVYVEERAHPFKDVQTIIGGLENVLNPRWVDLNELYEDGLRIIKGRVNGPKPGRKPGSQLYTLEDFVQALIENYRLLKKGTGPMPSKKAVAHAMEICRTTLYKYLSRYHIRWPPE
jgi:hypothetical protein